MIIPFVMVLVGAMLKKHPVSDMRSQNGYNTSASRRSQAHWDYAQRIAPGIFIVIGKWLLLLEIVISIAVSIFRMTAIVAVIVGNVVGFVVLFGGFRYIDWKIETFFIHLNDINNYP